MPQLVQHQRPLALTFELHREGTEGVHYAVAKIPNSRSSLTTEGDTLEDVNWFSSGKNS